MTLAPGLLASPAELAALAAAYPDHDVRAEATGTGIRYIARSRRLGARPHTVITASLLELRAALAAARNPR